MIWIKYITGQINPFLKFKPEKCNFNLRISTRDSHKWNCYLGDKDNILQHSTEEKDLGVIIDSKLTFDHHISQKVNKANSVLGQICRTFEHKDKTTMVTLFKSIVRPHLEYANQVWAPGHILL